MSTQPGPSAGAPARDLRSNAGLAAALRPALLRLARRLRHVRDQSLDLNSNQLSAMSVLFSHGDLLMGELAARELVKPPSMTRIVNELERRGYVVRKETPQDRRQARVSLTDAGRDVLAANRKRRTDWLARQLAGLEPAEREILRKAIPILEKVNRE
jgi:DNA-binding MarR family transcriptional regulator